MAAAAQQQRRHPGLGRQHQPPQRRHVEGARISPGLRQHRAEAVAAQPLLGGAAARPCRRRSAGVAVMTMLSARIVAITVLAFQGCAL